MSLAVVLFALLFVFFFVFVLVIYFSMPSRRDFKLYRKHALVTGGSKGIGKQIALQLIDQGCHVTIIARKEKDLEEACRELQLYADQRHVGQRVRWFACDLGNNYAVVEATVRKAEKEHGVPVEVLINNAGNSVQDAFEKLPVEDFEKQMKINYLSAVYTTRAVIEGMKSRREGHISFVSSAAGQCAIWGYSAYSAAKFAIRGFSDALRMELQPYKINVSVLYPPNTDTEGFAVEIATMPDEVRMISETAGLFTPQDVASRHVKDILRGSVSTTVGLDGWMLGTLTAGASAENSLPSALIQTFLAGIFRGVMLVYLGYFNGIVKRCYRKRLAEEPKEEEEEEINIPGPRD